MGFLFYFLLFWGGGGSAASLAPHLRPLPPPLPPPYPRTTYPPVSEHVVKNAPFNVIVHKQTAGGKATAVAASPQE